MVDTQRFEAQVSAPESLDALATALGLYRGDFLEEFSLPDLEVFDRWMMAERERFRQLAVHGYVSLAELHEAQQHYSAAYDTILRAVALDPLQEETQRVAMRIQYASGDRAGAIRRYEQLRAQLDDELGVPPMPETRALYDAIVTESLDDDVRPLAKDLPASSTNHEPYTLRPTKVAQPTALPFTGRSTELQQISALTAAHKLALIEGEPGIGKTRLVDEWLNRLDALVLRGGAYELERSLPYHPVLEAFRGLFDHPRWPTLHKTLDLAPLWRREVARLFPEIRTDESLPNEAGQPDESRLWEAVHQLLLALTRQAPVVLFLDDLHWADSATLALLGYLVRQTSSAALFFVATARGVAARSPLATLVQTLTRADRIGRILLQRLTPDDTVALAQHLSPLYSYPFAEWLRAASEGNPYVLAELVRYAREQNWLQTNGVINLTAISTSPIVPGAIYSLIASRLAAVSVDARRILDIAVAVGREFAFDVIARASDMDEATVLDALDELREAGLIRPTTDLNFAFDHSLTMEVAYREVGELRHRILHRQVGEAMKQVFASNLDSVAGLIASHFIEGNAPHRAAPYAFRAGQYAARLAAWNEAIRFFEQALVAGSEAHDLQTLLALGEAQLNAGEAAKATDTFRTAADAANTRNEKSFEYAARIELARALVLQGRYAEVIETVQPLLSTDEAASAEFFWGAALSLEGADLCGATEHLQQAARLLQNEATESRTVNLTRVSFELGNIAAQQGDLAQAIQHYREVVAIAVSQQQTGISPWGILGYNNLAYHLHLLNDPSALEYAHKGMALAKEYGRLDPQPYLLSTIGEILLAKGDIGGAERSFTDGLAVAEQLSMAERVAGLMANLGLVAIRQGNTDLAIHRLSTALARADLLGTQHLAAQIRIWLAPLLPLAEARTLLVEARAIAESGGRKLLLTAIAELERRFAIS
jgi:tetratricopeptide (TPR) repeat protein